MLEIASLSSAASQRFKAVKDDFEDDKEAILERLITC